MSYSSDKVKRWRKNNKARMVAAMGGSCQCCGYDACNNALAFHHLDPSKKDLTFASTRATPKSWTVIVEELKKCILVCHNCHSEIHAGVREIPDTFSSFNEDYADWRKVEELNECPICKKEKLAKKKFCSHRCSQISSRKVDWDSIDLIEMLKTHKISELEDLLGVSNAAIYKRRDKILQAVKKDVDSTR